MVTRAARTYLRVFEMGFREQLGYRGNLVVLASFSFAPLLAYIALWSSVFSRVPSGVWNGYHLREIITYFLIVSVVVKTTDTLGFEFDMAQEIREGRVAQFFTRPVNHLGFRMSAMVAGKAVVLLAYLAPLALAALLLNHWLAFQWRPATLPLALLVLVDAVLINFLISYLVVSLTFWWPDVSAFLVAKMHAMAFLSGALVPLDLLPAGVQTVFGALPFRSVVFVPVKALSGTWDAGQLGLEAALGLAWTAVLLGAVALTWRAAGRRLSLAGG